MPIYAFVLFFYVHLKGAMTENCEAPQPGTNGKLLQYTFKNVILHQDYQRCSSVDFSCQRVICEIWDEADGQALFCQGNPKCLQRSRGGQQLFSQCPDGTFNRTCIPTEYSYECDCYSNKMEEICTHLYSWGMDWYETRFHQASTENSVTNQDNSALLPNTCLVLVIWYNRWHYLTLR